MISTTCPKCRSNRIVGTADDRGMRYECHDCGNKWSAPDRDEVRELIAKEPDPTARELRKEFRLL